MPEGSDRLTTTPELWEMMYWANDSRFMGIIAGLLAQRVVKSFLCLDSSTPPDDAENSSAGLTLVLPGISPKSP